MVSALTNPDEKSTPLTFPAYLASCLPLDFLESVRPLITAGYEEAFKGIPVPDGELPYLNNLAPHNRNRLVFERLHEWATQKGLAVQSRSLDNGYFYPEIESKGLSVHIKHFNNYLPLKEQMVKADYRKQMTTLNSIFGQMPLFDKPMEQAPERAYVIMFYQDSPSKWSELGSVYFVLPSDQQGETIACSQIDEVIAVAKPKAQTASESESDDSIDLPSKHEEDEDQKAQ